MLHPPLPRHGSALRRQTKLHHKSTVTREGRETLGHACCSLVAFSIWIFTMLCAMPTCSSKRGSYGPHFRSVSVLPKCPDDQTRQDRHRETTDSLVAAQCMR